MTTCQACEHKFTPRRPTDFLCPDCARMAFVDKKCPFCGEGIIRPNKPTCLRCAAMIVGAEVSRDSMRCNHVFESGTRCKKWALKGGYYCSMHSK